MSAAHPALARLASLRRHVDRLEALRAKVVTGQRIGQSELLDALDSAREVTLERLRAAKTEVEKLRGAR